MKRMMPDYNNCIVNLSNSIRKEFGLVTYHSSLQELDLIFKKKYKNILLLVFDGMGSNILKNYSKKMFLNEYKLKDITSILPSTTVAATTSIQTGLFPREHAWIGCDLYIKNIDKIITMYKNKVRKTGEILNYNVGMKYFPYKTIVEEINDNTKYHAIEFFPFGKNRYNSFSELKKMIINQSDKYEKNFIYAYYNNPDSLLHQNDYNSLIVKNEIRKINAFVKDLSEKMHNTLIIITADHGHIVSEDFCLEDYSDINELIVEELSIEPRFTSFKIKKGTNNIFEKKFNQYFGNDFILFKHTDILENDILGLGNNNRYIDSMIGDYVAIGITNKYFRDSHSIPKYVSVHSGATDNEMLVPLILIEKNSK